MKPSGKAVLRQRALTAETAVTSYSKQCSGTRNGNEREISFWDEKSFFILNFLPFHNIISAPLVLSIATAVRTVNAINKPLSAWTKPVEKLRAVRPLNCSEKWQAVMRCWGQHEWSRITMRINRIIRLYLVTVYAMIFYGHAQCNSLLQRHTSWSCQCMRTGKCHKIFVCLFTCVCNCPVGIEILQG
jgi:hypothetical protein